MNYLYNSRISRIVCCAFILLTTSCKKGEYLTDGGVHTVQSSLSTYDYLANHTYHFFDTTLLLIDHFNLKDSVNKAGTFFAFTDYAVQRLMQINGYTELDSLYAHTTSKLITQYLFGTKDLTLDNVGVNPVRYDNWAGVSAASAVKKVQDAYSVYLASSAPAFNYFVLNYVKINGELDGATATPPDDPIDVSLPCQTTGIQTATGTTLHVLSNDALLNQL